MGGEDDGLLWSEHLVTFDSGVNWFVGNKGDLDNLFGARGARIVSPGAKEVSPVRDEIV